MPDNTLPDLSKYEDKGNTSSSLPDLSKYDTSSQVTPESVYSKISGVGSFGVPVNKVTNLPKEITANITPTGNENTPLPEIAPHDNSKYNFNNFLKAQQTVSPEGHPNEIGTQTPQGNKDVKSEQQLQEATRQYNEGLKTLPHKDPKLYTDEDKTQLGFINTIKTLKNIALTDPNAQNPQTREAFYKLYAKDYDAAHLQILKNIFEENAAIAGKYEKDRKLAHDNPENPDYVAAMGDDQLKAGDVSTASKTFNYIIKNHPDSVYGYQGMAQIANKQGHTEQAINFLTEGLKKKPDDVSSLNLRGNYLAMSGNDKAAMDDIDKSVKGAKYGTQDAMDAYYLRSELKKRQGDEQGSNADMGIVNNMKMTILGKQLKPQLELEQKNQLNKNKLEAAQKGVDIQGNFTKPVKYIDPATETEKELSPEEAKDILNKKDEKSINEEVGSVGTGIHGLRTDPLGYAMKYTAEGIQQIGGGVKEMEEAQSNLVFGGVDAGKNTLKELSGALNIAMGAGKFIPETAPAFAEFQVEIESASKVLPTKVVEAINNPYGAFGGNTEKNPDEANVVNNVANLTAMLLLHHVGGMVMDNIVEPARNKLVEFMKTGTTYPEGYVPPVEETKSTPKEDISKKTNIHKEKEESTPITTDKETYIKQGIEDYQKTPSFKAAIKNGVFKPSQLIENHRRALEVKYNESNKIEVKNGDVAKVSASDKLQNEQVLQDKDRHTISESVKTSSPQDIKEAQEKAKSEQAKKLTDNEVKALKKKGFSDKMIEGMQVTTPEPEKVSIRNQEKTTPITNESSDKVNELQKKVERLTKAKDNAKTEKAKANHQKNIEATNAEIEKAKSEPIKEETQSEEPKEAAIVNPETLNNPDGTVTINNRDLQGEKDALKTGIKQVELSLKEKLNKDINDLIANKNDFNNLSEGVRGKQKPENQGRKNRIEQKAKELGLKVKRFPNGNVQLLNEKGNPVNTRSIKGELEHTPLDQRSLETQRLFKDLSKQGVHSFPRVEDMGGEVMTKEAVKGAIKNIQDGKATYGAENVLNALDETNKSGTFRYGDKKEGIQQIPVEKVMKSIDEANKADIDKEYQKILDNFTSEEYEEHVKIIETFTPEGNNTGTEEGTNIQDEIGKSKEETITRNEKLKKGDFIKGNDVDVEFSPTDKENGSYVLSKSGEQYYKNGEKNPNNFLLGAKRSRILRPEPESETDVTKLGVSDHAHEGAPTINNRGETIQGDERTQRLNNLSDEEKEDYYNHLKSIGKEIGFTDKQIEESKEKGYVLQRQVNVDDNRAADLSQKDARDYMPKAPVVSMTQDQASNIRGLFNMPLEDVIFKNGKDLLQGLEDAGIINSLDYNKMLLGDTVNPVEVPNLVDKLRSVYDGGLKYNLPDKVQRSLDTIIPHILGMKEDVKPTKYIQKAISIIGEFPNENKLSFDRFMDSHNLTDVEKNITRVISDPVSLRTLPRLFTDYNWLVNGDEAQGIKGMSMPDALSHIFGGEEEPDTFIDIENDLNSKIHEGPEETRPIGNGESENANGNAVGETTGNDRTSPQGEPNGQNPVKKTTDTGKKLNDKFLGAIPEKENIQDLPDNLNITQNNVLGGIVNGFIRAFHWLRGSDMIGVQHSIGEYTDVYSGSKKSEREGLIQARMYLLKFQPDALEPENMTAVLNHFDRLQISNEPLTQAKYNIDDLNKKIQGINEDKSISAEDKKAKTNDLQSQLESLQEKLPQLKKNVDDVSTFIGENEGQNTMYGIVSDYQNRITSLADEMKDVKGLPESVLDMIKDSQGSGFIHRSILGFLDPAKQLSESESRKESTKKYKEGKSGTSEYFQGKANGLWQDIVSEWEEKYNNGGKYAPNDLTKSRSRFSAVDKEGNTHTLEFNDNGTINRHIGAGKEPVIFGDYDIKDSKNPSLKLIKQEGKVKDSEGNEYSINSGMTTDIERDTGDTYYKNPMESVFHTYLQMKDMHDMVTFFHSVKNDSRIQKFMTVLDNQQMGIIDQIKRKDNVLDKNDTKGLLGLIDLHNENIKNAFNGDNTKNKYNTYIDPKNEDGSVKSKKEMTASLLEAHDLPSDFIENNKSGTDFGHPIFDNTYFKNDAHSGILNALQTKKPDMNAITSPFMSWFYLSIEGTKHLVNSTFNTGVNMLNVHSLLHPNDMFWKPLSQAFDATLNNNELRKYLTSHGVNNFSNIPDDYNKSIVDVMAKGIKLEEPKEQDRFNKFIANASEGTASALKGISKSNKIAIKSLIWGMQDINTYSTILKEAAEMGLDVKNIDFNNKVHTDILDNAIKASAKNYVGYKLRNVEGISHPNLGKYDPGRNISKILGSRAVTIFSSYHVSLLKTLDAQREQIGKGLEQLNINTPKYKYIQRRAFNSAQRAAFIIGVGVYGIHKLEQEINKGGDAVYHVLDRPGLISIPHNIEQYAKGEISLGKLALDIFVPNPLLVRSVNTFVNHRTELNQPIRTSSMAMDYILNGASIPSMEYQTIGQKAEASLKQRVLPFYDTKQIPLHRSVTQQLYDYKDYFKPTFLKWQKEIGLQNKELNKQREDRDAGIEVTPIFNPIDSAGYKKFIDDSYNTSGDLLLKFQNFATQRISQIRDGIFVPSSMDKYKMIENYQSELNTVNNMIKERANTNSANKKGISFRQTGFLNDVKVPNP